MTERLTAFDPTSMSLIYDTTSGLPGFTRAAIDRWSVAAIGSENCEVASHATVELGEPPRLLGPVMKVRVKRDRRRFFEELRDRIEHGEQHPPKARTA